MGEEVVLEGAGDAALLGARYEDCQPGLDGLARAAGQLLEELLEFGGVGCEDVGDQRCDVGGGVLRDRAVRGGLGEHGSDLLEVVAGGSAVDEEGYERAYCLGGVGQIGRD